MAVSDAGYYLPNERKRIKVAKWGTPKKKYFFTVTNRI
jgi:hypothetical protein